MSESDIINTAARAARTATLLRVAATPWTCEFCGRSMTLNGKGNHLKHCKKNPDRPLLRRRGSSRQDLVVCDFCEKRMAPASLSAHIRNQCRVAKAVRDGRLVAAPERLVSLSLQELDPVPTLSFADQAGVGQQPEAYDPGGLDLVSPGPFDQETARSILYMAVEQIVDGLTPDVRAWGKIHRSLEGLLGVLNEELS